MEVYSLNVNGLNDERIEELRTFLKARRPAILFLQETKRRSDKVNEKLYFPGYHVSTLEREGSAKGGGGMCTLWRNDINLTPCSLEVDEKRKWISKERQWFLLRTKTLNLAFVNVYMACSRSDTQEYLKWNRDLRDTLISEATLMNNDSFKVVMTGDFNSWLGNTRGGCFSKNHPEVNPNGVIVGNMIDVLNMMVANADEKHGEIFTRVQYDHAGLLMSQTCLDLCVYDPTVPVTEFEVLKDEECAFNSDHFAIRTVIDVINCKPARFRTRSLPYNVRGQSEISKLRYKKISLRYLKSTPLAEFSSMRQIEQIKHIEDSLLRAAKTTFPVKRKKPTLSRVPVECRDLIRQRKCLLRDIKNGVSNRVGEFYRLNKRIKVLTKSYQFKKRKRAKITLAQDDPTREKFWSIFRRVKNRSCKIPALRNSDGQLCTDSNDMKSIVYDSFKVRLSGSEEPVPPYIGVHQNDVYSGNNIPIYL